MIHDTYSRKMFDAIKLSSGLYLLTFHSISLTYTLQTHYTNVIHPHNLGKHNDFNLWHLRFGHPSNAKLFEINIFLPMLKFIIILLLVTYFYTTTKRRITFSHSSHTSNIFYIYLFRMVIWDILFFPSLLGLKYFITVIDDKNVFTWIFLIVVVKKYRCACHPCEGHGCSDAF